MPPPYAAIITSLWVVWVAYWAVSAVALVKPTLRTEGVESRLAYSLPLGVAAWLMFGGQVPEILDGRFVPDAAWVAILASVLTAAGLSFSVWARIVLGRNWSGMVSVKQGHELVERGPYRLVRHPIYAGLILALLGTALAIGEWRGLLAVALAVGSFWYKLRIEERLMRETFGRGYDEYARRVKALLPFVI